MRFFMWRKKSQNDFSLILWASILIIPQFLSFSVSQSVSSSSSSHLLSIVVLHHPLAAEDYLSVVNLCPWTQFLWPHWLFLSSARVGGGASPLAAIILTAARKPIEQQTHIWIFSPVNQQPPTFQTKRCLFSFKKKQNTFFFILIILSFLIKKIPKPLRCSESDLLLSSSATRSVNFDT